jgi:hypothetical protein
MPVPVKSQRYPIPLACKQLLNSRKFSDINRWSPHLLTRRKCPIVVNHHHTHPVETEFVFMSATEKEEEEEPARRSLLQNEYSC